MVYFTEFAAVREGRFSHFRFPGRTQMVGPLALSPFVAHSSLDLRPENRQRLTTLYANLNKSLRITAIDSLACRNRDATPIAENE